MNWNNKTLIILIPGFPANEDDSTCVPFPQAFVKILKQLNPALNIKVLAFQYPFFGEVYEWHQVEVHAFNGRNRAGFRRVLLWMTIWQRLKKICGEDQVVGILSFWLGEAALMAKFAANKYRIKSYTWLMGQDARINNRYVSLVNPNQDSLIALSDFLVAEFYKNYKIRPANTIPPGIDMESFPVASSVRKIDILGVGSLIPLKRFDQLIKMLSRLRTYHPTIKAIICGEGPERAKLQKQIHDNDLMNQVELRGELNHEEILELMQGSKILVHPSSYEGFSTVCAEALYAGAQVVSYCKPMLIDFAQHHIVQTQEEMENKVEQLINEENPNHDRVLTYPMHETCSRILALYS
jgi:glycosyltransferase involved in cell wall biosynthesis